jgi:hypothetical protein
MKDLRKDDGLELNEAITILEEHNKWRRGDEEIQMENPTKLGVAIDVILESFKNKTAQ